VSYVAGYPLDESSASPTDYATNVPQDIKAAVKLMLGHLYRARESLVVGQAAIELPLGVRELLGPHRVYDYNLAAA
jgi:hypothetical protein